MISHRPNDSMSQNSQSQSRFSDNASDGGTHHIVGKKKGGGGGGNKKNHEDSTSGLSGVIGVGAGLPPIFMQNKGPKIAG